MAWYNPASWFSAGNSKRPAGRTEVFSFGDPVPVLDGTDIVSCLQCLSVGKWYETPFSPEWIAKTSRVGVHHASALRLKRDILSACFVPHKYFSRQEFTKYCQDFLIFGNGYVERRDNRLGQPLSLQVSLAKYSRRAGDLQGYFYLPEYRVEYEFKPGSVFHLMEPDINQDIYGIPYYLAGLASAMLNGHATLFRIRYYLNGSHAGFILYVTDPAQNEEDIGNLRKALKESKGVGNFRNLFYYSPGGKADGMKLIPVAEVMAKDEFFNIKNTTRDDMLAIHRTPPQIMGVVPSNTGGFGDVVDAAQVYYHNEIQPLAQRLSELNEWIGEEVVRFGPYALATPPAPAPVIR